MPLEFEKIRGVFERSPVALTLADMSQPDQPLILTNARFSNLTHYGETEMLGVNCRFLQKEGENPQARAEVKEAMAAGQEVQVIFRNYRKGGEPFDNLLFLHPIGKVDGRPEYYLGSQFELVGEAPDILDASGRHVDGLSSDLQRLEAITAQLHAERRRHLANTAAALVRTWVRSR